MDWTSCFAEGVNFNSTPFLKRGMQRSSSLATSSEDVTLPRCSTSRAFALGASDDFGVGVDLGTGCETTTMRGRLTFVWIERKPVRSVA